MKLYSVYLFDFDYTLVDSSRGIVQCFRNVLTKHGYDQVDDLTIKRTIGKTLEQSFSIMTGITDAETLALYRKEYVREADQYMTVNTKLFPETIQVLKRLKENGARLGIISTKYRYRIWELMSQYLSEDFLDIVFGGEDVSCPKPDPEGLRHALSVLGVSPQEVLYVGDSIVDAETARAAGVDFAGVLHGMTTREELCRYPHVVILPDLCGLSD
ncbi:MAG TPA: HAD-IA family hydrolase [Candidatus Paraprevotella stercorigallinarum]|nr:HAD-IA family hydrolase [Candidatus Paraprevotella stercorigallinarum]